MDSKEETSLSGFSPVSSDNIGIVNETNGLNSVIKVDGSNGSNRLIASTTSSSSSSSSSNSDDENEGFASGEEEAFETNLDENLVLGGETLANVDEGESFLEPSEFPVPKVELATVNDGGLDDDAEKNNLVEKDVGLVEKGTGSIVVDEKPELEDNLNLNLNSNEAVKEPVMEVEKPELGKSLNSNEAMKGPVMEDKKPEFGESLNLNEAMKEPVMEDEKAESEENLKSNSHEAVKEPLIKDSEGDKAGEDKEGIVDETSSKAVSNDELKSDNLEQGGNEVIEANGPKLTTEGDSIVEEIKVDTPAPGVAVVTNTEEEEDEDEDEGVVLVGGPDDTVVESPEPAVGADAVKFTSEGDFVVEAIDVDLPLPAVPGVAVVTNTQEDGGAVDVNNESDSLEKMDRVLEEVVDKEVVGVTHGKFSPLDDETSVDYNLEKNEKNPDAEVEKEVDYQGQENGSVVKATVGDVEVVPPVKAAQMTEDLGKTMPDDATEVTEDLDRDMPDDADAKAKHIDSDNGLENGPADKFVLEESAAKDDGDEEGYVDGSPSDEDTDGMIFGSSEAAKQFMEELEQGSGGGGSSQDRSGMIDGQIVTDSDEEDDEEGGKELFDSRALAALLKAAADGGSEDSNITFSSQDGSRLFTVERPAGLGPSLPTMRAAPRPTRSTLFNSSSLMTGGETETNLSDEERKKLEKLQAIRVKFLRLVQRLGLSPDESVAAQVLYRLALIAGRQTGQSFSVDAAKRKAAELEAEGNDDLDFSVNILVIGKAGVGKSATINSIFGEEKTVISAFQPATASVKEIRGVVGGVTIRVFDTPGLRSSVMEQGFNRSVLSSTKKLTKKNPPDIVLYVDRLDAQTRDNNDIPLLRTITSSLGPAIWRNAIVTLTHGASAPPEGPNGIPLSYEMFVTQRSHVVQQAIGQSVGDLRMMSPSLMNPVSLVENHPSCRKNREGQKVLPNGQTWRPQLLLLCYSMKILSEANSLTKPQDPYDNRKLFGFRVRSPPLPYMLSSMLQSRAHPKLSSEQGGDGGDSDVDLADLTESDQEEDEDEYDQLPPFKPLKKSQLAKLSREQRNAYFDEYDYRVKLLQKKQWKEELKRMKEMKKKGKDGVNDSNTYPEEEGEGDAPAPVAVPLPDMVLPPSFDSDNPAYRFRFLEPTSQFLARPVLDTHGWDHDCGYDGVNVEQTLAIANRFPAAVSIQVTKDKKDFSINMDSSVSAKHGEKGSSMAGFDIQPIGKQLAYIVRGETKFKNMKKNKTAAGVSVTFLGENVVTGFKCEDQVAFGKQYSLIGSAGTVRFQSDSAYGANIEVQRRELDYPIGQVQSTFGLSIIKWRGDLALGFNSLAQFSAGRNSKVAVRAGINNKMSGQITVKTSSSEHLSLALAAVIPSVISAYKKFWSSPGEKDSTY